jgi:type I restriction enzyme M protein
VNALYSSAYRHYIDPNRPDDIDPRRFSAERVKSVVQQLEGMALTKGAALNADIIGAFFEEILRSGFKQDRGMYFTHDNIARFMVEAVGLRDLTRKRWRTASHPEQRLPYVFDPACGSGTFLLHSMHTITDEVRSNRAWFARTESDEDFLNQNLSDAAPNGWAKDFLYGFDPKFIMALTAKLNMVLHGDGVAHIFKEDSFKPIGSYSDARLRPVGAPTRSLAESIYLPKMCETFDVVISNPPFGVTLPPETRQTLGQAFTMPPHSSTEALFIERAFQLLRPKGRLAVVLPESVLNAAESDLRLFLMRMFHVRAVITMPRHIFVDTPTLTSLLFAQKKTAEEIAQWDSIWEEEKARLEAHVAAARRHLTVSAVRIAHSVDALQSAVLVELAAIGPATSWVMKRGQNGGPLTFALSASVKKTSDAVRYYQELLRLPGFQDLLRQAVFKAVTAQLDAAWPCYIVDEVGFKLSKRGERARENQLATLVDVQTQKEVANLHLATETTRVVISREHPKTVLDFMANDVTWS